MNAFVGIDVAFAKGKRLPLCVCTWSKGRLVPLPLKRELPDVPRGSGNRFTIQDEVVDRFAEQVAQYLHDVEKHFRVSICRVAIDAPSSPRLLQRGRRAAEEALDCSCFTTPSDSEFAEKRAAVERHLERGGAESNLPAANQLWMLVGFALFKTLGLAWDCLEVYPQATMRSLHAAALYKRKKDGAALQLQALSQYTGWPHPFSVGAIREVVCAPLHDAVDAYSCAWIAALERENRTALGNPPNDVIWVPKVTVLKPAF